MKIYRNPETVHAPVAHYSHQIETTGPQRFLTLSGQIGMAKNGIISKNPSDQFRIALENIQKNLEAANMSMENITKLVFYIVGEMDNEDRGDILLEFFQEKPPCTTLIFVSALASPNLKVEIDAWASTDV